MIVDYQKGRRLVSVVIPCYNYGTFLLEAVNSVLNSTYSPVEVIIVDDGSVDCTKEIARTIMDKHGNVSYIYQENQGPSVARNRGIEEAKGTYVLPLDADDKISPHYIERAVEVLESRSMTKVVYCDAQYFGAKSGHWKLKKFSLKRLAISNMIFSCSMFRKNDWKEVGGYSSELIGGWEDWEFWISMLKNGGLVHKLPFSGFYYRIHRCSRQRSTTSEIEKQTADFINRKHHDFVGRQLGRPFRIKRKNLSMQIDNLLMNVSGRIVDKLNRMGIRKNRQDQTVVSEIRTRIPFPEHFPQKNS